jgi:NAD(P)-dependent dehydrogenase (short-subunit alcohol dehydrogenase family)
MRVDLSGRAVIVTGAGRGIGRAIASMAAEAGATVVLAARTAEQLETVRAEIAAKGGRALAVPTDLTDPVASLALVRRALDELGRLDALVNNAGTNLIANLVMSKEEQWRSLFDVNVFAVFRLTKEALRPMIKAKSGRIINISSVAGKVGAAYASAYAASKAAVDAFTRSVALETAKLGITANTICPWHVDTELLHHGMGKRGQMFGATAEEYIAAIARSSPQERLVTAREVASLAIYLMSSEASGITGQSINVSGGAV